MNSKLKAFGAFLIAASLVSCKGFTSGQDEEDDNTQIDMIELNEQISFDKASLLLFTDETQSGQKVILSLNDAQKLSVKKGLTDIRWEITDGGRANLMLPGMSGPASNTIQSNSSGSVDGYANTDAFEVTILPTQTPGQATLSAIFESIELGVRQEAACGITVLAKPSISISPASQNIMLRSGNAPTAAIQYTARVEPAGLLAWEHTIDWASSNDFAAGVTQGAAKTAASVIGKAPGTAQITATITVRGRTASGSGTINVRNYGEPEVPVTGITLSQTEDLDLIQTNTSGDITVVFSPTNASNKDVTWSAYPEGVLEIVNGSGIDKKRIRAVESGGPVMVTATANDDFNGTHSASFYVNITPLSISFLNGEGARVTSGSTYILLAQVAPSGASGKDVTWAIVGENANKARVSSNFQGSPAMGVIRGGLVTEPTQVTVRATASSDSSVYADRILTVAPHTFNLAFNGNGNTGGQAPSRITVTYGTDVELPYAGSLVKSGDVLEGWNTQADGSGTTYMAGSYALGTAVDTAGATKTLYAKWGMAIADANSKDLMIKFGVKSAGYDVNGITRADVENTFYLVSRYLKTQSGNTVNPVNGLGVINYNDYIKIPNVYAPGNYDLGYGVVSPPFDLPVVGINSYNGINDNGYSPHLVFGAIGPMRTFNSSNTNSTGYLNSAIRAYIIGEFLTGLKNAGVPDSVLWAPSRRLANRGAGANGTQTIQDKLFLASEREVLGYNQYSNGNYETEANQARFPVYTNNDSRYGGRRWLASPAKDNTTDFCAIATLGYIDTMGAYSGPSTLGGGNEVKNWFCYSYFCVK